MNTKVSAVLPHEWACRLWRWATLKTAMELSCLPCCDHGYERNTSEICIQPYHYNKIEAPGVEIIHFYFIFSLRLLV